jgi:chitinase
MQRNAADLSTARHSRLSTIRAKGTMKLLATLLLALFAGLPAAAAPRLLVGYYLATPAPERYVAPDTIPARKLTHLNYAFADIRDGEIVVGNPAIDTAGPDNFAKLRALKRKHPRLKTLIAVGGWEWSGGFSDVALTPQSRAKFAASGVAFVRRHGFDGIDIDWEFPVAGGMPANVKRPEDKQNFTLLLQALREQLDSAGREDGRRYLLTAAVGSTASFVANTEIVAVADTLDWLNVMTYDMSGPWSKQAGHVAPLRHDPALDGPNVNPKNNVAGVIDLYLAAGVPARKMVLGVPFYGYIWKGCAADRHGQYQPCEGPGRGTWEEGALDYSDIEARYAARSGFRRHWNEASGVPFLHNARTGEFITYEDTRSLRRKMRFMKEKQLAGVMFWQLTADRRHRLLDVLARELASGSGRAP